MSGWVVLFIDRDKDKLATCYFGQKIDTKTKRMNRHLVNECDIINTTSV